VTCGHKNRNGYEEHHEPRSPSAGNYCVKTVRVWCEDCGELIWKYEVYLDGMILTRIDVQTKSKSGEHLREEKT
jgi:hypothetical protein